MCWRFLIFGPEILGPFVFLKLNFRGKLIEIESSLILLNLDPKLVTTSFEKVHICAKDLQEKTIVSKGHQNTNMFVEKYVEEPKNIRTPSIW